MTDPNSIYFYSNTEGPHACFSNFSHHGFVLNGKHWTTSEHYFQAQKFAGTPYEEQVRFAKSPGQAKKIGGNRSLPLRGDWEKVKENVMKDALIAKFTQNKDILEVLLSTGGKTLVEHTVNDTYWGDGGGEGCGKNRLGYVLMQVRDELLQSNSSNSNSSNSNTSNFNSSNSNSNPNPSTSTSTSTNNNNTTSNKVKDISGNIGDSSSDENSQDSGEFEEVDGVEPNHNRLFEAGASAEKKPLPAKTKKARRGGNKSRGKRGVFRDADGSSKLEKTTEKKGNVTVIGDGLVFSEKALPPQAKNKHQMQRKYHPTEVDFEDEEDDETPQSPVPVPKRKMADFLKPVPSLQPELPQTQPQQLFNESMSVAECLDAAKSNLDLLGELTDPEIKGTIQESCRKLRDLMRMYVEQLSEADENNQLESVIEQFDKLEAVC